MATGGVMSASKFRLAIVVIAVLALLEMGLGEQIAGAYGAAISWASRWAPHAPLTEQESAASRKMQDDASQLLRDEERMRRESAEIRDPYVACMIHHASEPYAPNGCKAASSPAASH